MLALLCPGLGHVYAERPRLGAALFVAFCVGMVAAPLLFWGVARGSVWITTVVVLAFHVGQVRHAAR